MEIGRRIDLVSTVRTIRHATFGALTVYDLGNRLLYPAYDVGCRLHLLNPSPMGCACRKREIWLIQVKRCVLRDGSQSYQVLRKNFIPAEDVRWLAESSKDPQAAEICKWILTLESREEAE